MSEWWLGNNGNVLTYNGKGMISSDRIPYVDIKCPQGFDPEAAGCGKPYGHWSIVDTPQNIWRYECKFDNWRELFYNNRNANVGDFWVSDGYYHSESDYDLFEVVGSGNCDLVVRMEGMFRDCEGLRSCVTINTHNCINLSAMFSECDSLVEVPYLDTANCLDFNNFVVNCPSLKRINPNIDLHNGRSFWWFAYGCEKLEEVPTFDLRNADDTFQGSYARRGGNDHMFTFCHSLEYIHLIGGAGMKYLGGMFMHTGVPMSQGGVGGNLVIDWEDCYLPLVIGNEVDPDTSYTTAMFTQGVAGLDAAYESVTTLNFPNLYYNADMYFPSARKYEDILMPKINGWYTHRLGVPRDCTQIGTIDFSNGTDVFTPGAPIPMINEAFSDMFRANTGLTKFPDVRWPSTGSYNFSQTFMGMVNVNAGAYDMYQSMSSAGIARTHEACFYHTGLNTTNGRADLLQIPSDWKGGNY